MVDTAKRVIVATVDNCTKWSDGTFLVKGVRFSHPHVFTPTAMADPKTKVLGTPSFSIIGLMPKASHQAAMKMLRDRCNELLAENRVQMLAADRKFIRDGNLAGKVETVGHWTLSAREQQSRPPTVRGPDKAKWGKDKEALIYGGCWGNLLIRPWFQPQKGFGIRINAGLTAVQFVRNGEAFGSGRISEDEIDDTFADESDNSDMTGEEEELDRIARESADL